MCFAPGEAFHREAPFVGALLHEDGQVLRALLVLDFLEGLGALLVIGEVVPGSPGEAGGREFERLEIQLLYVDPPLGASTKVQCPDNQISVVVLLARWPELFAIQGSDPCLIDRFATTVCALCDTVLRSGGLIPVLDLI